MSHGLLTAAASNCREPIIRIRNDCPGMLPLNSRRRRAEPRGRLRSTPVLRARPSLAPGRLHAGVAASLRMWATPTPIRVSPLAFLLGAPRYRVLGRRRSGCVCAAVGTRADRSSGTPLRRSPWSPRCAGCRRRTIPSPLASPLAVGASNCVWPGVPIVALSVPAADASSARSLAMDLGTGPIVGGSSWPTAPHRARQSTQEPLDAAFLMPRQLRSGAAVLRRRTPVRRARSRPGTRHLHEVLRRSPLMRLLAAAS